jgi:DNA replication protein DnaC
MPSAGWKNASPTSPSRRLLIVDELGYLPLEPDAAHLFFRLVSRRYEKGAMLITSSRPTTNI